MFLSLVVISSLMEKDVRLVRTPLRRMTELHVDDADLAVLAL